MSLWHQMGGMLYHTDKPEVDTLFIAMALFPRVPRCFFLGLHPLNVELRFWVDTLLPRGENGPTVCFLNKVLLEHNVLVCLHSLWQSRYLCRNCILRKAYNMRYTAFRRTSLPKSGQDCLSSSPRPVTL